MPVVCNCPLPRCFSYRDLRPSLPEMSTWLARYALNSPGCTEPIEVPGQYDGDSKPDPSNHVKIVSFGEKLLTMSSIRKPKRLTILGHDEREYLFLVKGGEDLRLDQRIQQLFEVLLHACPHII